MGCDIHAFIEVEYGPEKNVMHFASLSMKRDYQLFGLLAGVRGGDAVVSSPRGITDNLSWEVKEQYTYQVADEPCDNERLCTQEEAERWIGYGSQWMNDKHTLVSGPDWHSASYLYLDELIEVMAHYTNEKSYNEIFDHRSGNQELFAIVAMMKYLSGTDTRARLVFWFDN